MRSWHEPAAQGTLLLAFAVLAWPASRAAAEVKYDLAATGDVTIANNPLLLAGTDLSALTAEASIEPGARWTGATGSSLGLNGILTARSYSQRYGSFLLGRARADTVIRRDERLTARASLDFDRNISADILTATVDAWVDPRSTRNAWDAATSLAWMPNARTTITPGLRFTSARFGDSSSLGSSKVYVADLRIDNRLTARTSIGLSASGSRSDVTDGGRFGTLSVLATLAHRFNEIVQMTGEVGLERVRDRINGGEATNFAGRGQLCAKGERNQGCFDASLASQVSAAGSLQRRFAVGANFTRSIGQYWDLGLAANYQRVSRSGIGQSPTVNAETARASLDWRFTRNVTLGAQLEYRRRDLGQGQAPDSGYAGINLRWQR